MKCPQCLSLISYLSEHCPACQFQYSEDVYNRLIEIVDEEEMASYLEELNAIKVLENISPGITTVPLSSTKKSEIYHYTINIEAPDPKIEPTKTDVERNNLVFLYFLIPIIAIVLIIVIIILKKKRK